jgi:hypothetical protein
VNTSKIEARIKGISPGVPRHRYKVHTIEEERFRRIYPQFNGGLPPSQVEIEWQGRIFPAQLKSDGERYYYEFSIKSGWEPTPNNPEHDELVSLIQDFSQNRSDLGER